VISTDSTTPIVTHEDRLNVDESFLMLKMAPATIPTVRRDTERTEMASFAFLPGVPFDSFIRNIEILAGQLHPEQYLTRE
jgi:hypothetical protein